MPALPGRRRVKIWARAIEPDCYEGSILNSLIICLDNGVHFTAAETINLRAMDSLSQVFGLKTGYSDHSQGITIPVAAVARGAKVIEKHFTLDKSLPGPDHQASLEPDELKAMIDAIRITEAALGSPLKTPQPSEIETMRVARKSLVAGCQIAKGERFSAQNLSFKRPGNGLSPDQYWRLLGKKSQKAYDKDELIDSGE